MIFCVSNSIVTLPVISSTLAFETPPSLDIACRRLSDWKVAHVLHAVHPSFEVFRTTFSVFIGSSKADDHIQEFKSIVTTCCFVTIHVLGKVKGYSVYACLQEAQG